jgi:hypothetical protein
MQGIIMGMSVTFWLRLVAGVVIGIVSFVGFILPLKMSEREDAKRQRELEELEQLEQCGQSSGTLQQLDKPAATLSTTPTVTPTTAATHTTLSALALSPRNPARTPRPGTPHSQKNVVKCSAEHMPTTCTKPHGHQIPSNNFLNSPFYKILKAFSAGELLVAVAILYIFVTNIVFNVHVTYACAGVILGVALLHLLDDSHDKLMAVTTKPRKHFHDLKEIVFMTCLCMRVVAQAFVCVGVMVTLCLEQVTVSITQHQAFADIDDDEVKQPNKQTTDQKQTDKNSSHSSKQLKEMEEAKELISEAVINQRQQLIPSSVYNNYGSTQQLTESITQQADDKDEETKFKLRASHALARTIVLETSVFIHYVIIGFGLGTTSELAIIRVMIIALSCHQFFEGISLGSMILEAHTLSPRIKYVFACVFAVSLPVGLFTGMFVNGMIGNSSGSDPSNNADTDTQSNTSRNELLLTGIANAVAAGSLLYTCLVEIVHEEFKHCWVTVNTPTTDTHVDKVLADPPTDSQVNSQAHTPCMTLCKRNNHEGHGSAPKADTSTRMKVEMTVYPHSQSHQDHGHDHSHEHSHGHSHGHSHQHTHSYQLMVPPPSPVGDDSASDLYTDEDSHSDDTGDDGHTHTHMHGHGHCHGSSNNNNNETGTCPHKGTDHTHSRSVVVEMILALSCGAGVMAWLAVYA